MCGIIFEISDVSFKTTKDSEVIRRIKKRGPDCKNTVTFDLSSISITCYATVLWLQGSEPVAQPLENDKGILLYNGDIMDWSWNGDRNDTLQIMDRFTNAVTVSSEEIIEEIRKFKGPFSLIYFNKLTKELIFTRDKIGRNSLLFHNTSHSITISSVLGRRYDCIEIPATNIYVLNILTHKIKIYPWDKKIFEYEYEIDKWVENVKSVQSQPDEHFSLDCSVVDVSQEDSVRRFIENAALETKDKLTVMETLLKNIKIKQVVTQLLNLLDKSIEIRTKKQPMKCKNCLYSMTVCNHSSLGVLFSGGLDCTLLAYLADKHLPKEQSIELVNVAFKKDKDNYDVPDRVTGKQSLEELKKLCPHRNWRFKEVNVPNDLLMKYQETTIADLVYPRKTILDESLGSALWFAAQGSDDGVTESPCRVLLLGSGADELFGGYTRHRNAFKRHGWTGLSKELLLDWKRISFRNLARDNRVICDHGKQPRMPYLDEDFTQYVLDLKPWFKCFPSENLGHGIGDKLILRLVAFHIGLKKVSVLPKRALQFGSRIANKKEKGSDLSKNFQATI